MKNDRNKWLLRYSVMFALVAAAFIACFALFGKYMVGVRDGVHQHYTALAYIHDAIRDLLAGRGFKMVDLQLGQGLDTIGTLAYYGLFDPINWLSALFSLESMEICYGLLIGLRMYLLGLFFCMYLRRIHIRDSWAISVSGIIYVCCGFYLKAVPRHPFFADGGIYLALMLIAVERVLQERKWLMLVLTCALMLIANYYFAFQTTLLVVCYILVRLFCTIRQEGVKASAGRGFTLLGAYLLGAALAAIVFVPVLRCYMGNARLTAEGGYSGSLLHYDALYYIKLFAYLCAPYATTGSWMHENLCPLALIGLIVLFSRNDNLDLTERRRVRQMRVMFIIVCVFACVPMFGKLFNGLGYVCNRWCYGFAFAACVALAWALPRMFDAHAQRTAFIACVLALLTACTALINGMLAVLIAASSAAMLLFAALILFRPRMKISREGMNRVNALLAAGCCCVYVAMIYLPLGGSFAVDYGEGRFYDTLMNETEAVSMQIEDRDTCRIDCGAVDDCHATIFSYNGTGYYWSVVPAHVYAYYRDLHMNTQESAGRLCALGSSAALNAVAGVRYALRNAAKPASAPYGYCRVDTVLQEDGDQIDIYENQYALPIGYVYENTLSETAYRALNAADKQAALIACAVTEDSENNEAASVAAEVAWAAVSAQDVEMEENSFIVGADGGSITLQFEGLAGCETIVDLDGIRCREAMGTEGIAVSFESTVTTAYGSICDPAGNFCHDQTGIAANIGYSESGQTQCRISFAAAGTYDFEAIHVYCLPMTYYTDCVSALRENAMSDVEISNNRISGSVTSDGGTLQIAVPYGEGWTATVDGVEQTIYRCGGMYIGLDIEAGAHEIVLTYHTPMLRTGAIISACAAVFTAALWLLTRKRARAKR